jgi:CoA:oxalate CoA-transferase
MLPWLLEHDKVDIFKAGQDHGLGFSFVAGMEDILAMEQLVARDYFVQLEHPIAGTLKYPGPPISPDSGDVAAWVYRRAPLLAEHCIEILGGLGYSSKDVESLFAEGVI